MINIKKTLAIISLILIATLATGCKLGPVITSTDRGASYHTEYDDAASSKSASTVKCGLDINTLQRGDPYVTAVTTPMFEPGLCGACLKVIGTESADVTYVRVIDQCDGCGEKGLDLSPTAFKEIGQEQAGLLDITWEIVSCTEANLQTADRKISLRWKDGSSKYWHQLQIVDHDVPIESVEIGTDGSYTASELESHNYYTVKASTPLETPFNVRVTSTTGEQLIIPVNNIGDDESVLVPTDYQFTDCMGSQDDLDDGDDPIDPNDDVPNDGDDSPNDTSDDDPNDTNDDSPNDGDAPTVDTDDIDVGSESGVDGVDSAEDGGMIVNMLVLVLVVVLYI
eukprot:TRINITY_DN10003_c0_g1_i1.p1 TRINITY_DN10003_c0_g1~~TRINITY_DN10003_c0_g1_i1.p1  ORF type:complete len:339 (+),score=83.14 TRINITY_DN10003_c0_g1_i1:3-1019(+)